MTAHVHQGAIDVLGPVVDPHTVHQSKFSMGTVLGLIAVLRTRRPGRVRRPLPRPAVTALRARVMMRRDAEVDAAYPARWIGKVTVKTRDGRTLHARVDEPKGDPGNTLTRGELEDKALRLAAYAGGASAAEMQRVIARVGRLRTSIARRDFSRLTQC